MYGGSLAGAQPARVRPPRTPSGGEPPCRSVARRRRVREEVRAVCHAHVVRGNPRGEGTNGRRTRGLQSHCQPDEYSR